MFKIVKLLDYIDTITVYYISVNDINKPTAPTYSFRLSKLYPNLEELELDTDYVEFTNTPATEVLYGKD